MLSASCARFGGAGGAGGFGGPPAPEGVEKDTPLIGLRRGSAWSVLTIQPPHLSGPLFHMMLKNGVLTGAISGGTAPPGTLRVNIKSDGAEGFGPLGPVSLDYTSDESTTTAEGTWNGGRVHLVFSHDSLHGTVATNSFFYSKSNSSGLAGGEAFRQPGMRAFGKSADYLEPLPTDQSCEYFLDHLSADGALDGGSTCAGMPQRTRLEVPEMAHTWLSQPELVTILVAVLATPPVVIAENYGPKIEPPSTGNPLRVR